MRMISCTKALDYLQDEAGLDRSYYGSVEQGERNIAALNLMFIAAALQVEIGELLPKREVFESLLEPLIVEER